MALPDDEDFRKGVQPLARPRQSAIVRTPPAPVPRQTRRDARDALDSGEELAFLRESYPRDILRKLRRGHWTVEANLDLHGMNRVEADAAVREFLRRSTQLGQRCVRIVHGRGLGSPNREPVLKAKLRKWLAVRDDVLAFSQAPRAHGGSGAALVLLKNP